MKYAWAEKLFFRSWLPDVPCGKLTLFASGPENMLLFEDLVVLPQRKWENLRKTKALLRIAAGVGTKEFILPICI